MESYFTEILILAQFFSLKIFSKVKYYSFMIFPGGGETLESDHGLWTYVWISIFIPLSPLGLCEKPADPIIVWIC